MKKTFKKFMLMLVVVLAAASIMTTTPAKAATKVKINKTSATLVKGKTLQLKITGTKNKISWKSSNKSVAPVTSKGKVTAKKAGKATIYAKVKIGRTYKTYKCKISVKNPVNPINYKDNVNISYTIYKQGLIATVENNNSEAIYIKIDCNMFQGSYSNIGSMDNLCLGAGKSCKLFTEFLSADNEYLEPDSYEITDVTVKKSEYVDYSDGVTLGDFRIDGCQLKFSSLNQSGKKLELTKPNVVFLYYDADNNIIGCFGTILSCDYSQPDKYPEFALLPEEYTTTGPTRWVTIVPDHYEYYINCAF